jgi:non-homologous end joining protein Ku
MSVSTTEIVIGLVSSGIGGIGVSLLSSIQERKRENVRKNEREQDKLKLELKDLQIKLYQLEIDLAEWKDKYYEAIQELIKVKAELENTILKLNHIEIHHTEG